MGIQATWQFKPRGRWKHLNSHCVRSSDVCLLTGRSRNAIPAKGIRRSVQWGTTVTLGDIYHMDQNKQMPKLRNKAQKTLENMSQDCVAVQIMNSSTWVFGHFPIPSIVSSFHCLKLNKKKTTWENKCSYSNSANSTTQQIYTTQVDTILGVEAGVVYQVDAAPYHIPCGKRGAVWLASPRGTERVTVITMVTIGLLVPTCNNNKRMSLTCASGCLGDCCTYTGHLHLSRNFTQAMYTCTETLHRPSTPVQKLYMVWKIAFCFNFFPALGSPRPLQKCISIRVKRLEVQNTVHKATVGALNQESLKMHTLCVWLHACGLQAFFNNAFPNPCRRLPAAQLQLEASKGVRNQECKSMPSSGRLMLPVAWQQ